MVCYNKKKTLKARPTSVFRTGSRTGIRSTDVKPNAKSCLRVGGQSITVFCWGVDINSVADAWSRACIGPTARAYQGSKLTGLLMAVET